MKKVEFGADIFAAGVSTVAPPLGIAYFGAKGAWKASKGDPLDIRIVDEQFRDIGRELSPESKEAGMSFLFSGISGIGYAGKIGSDITKLRKAELVRKPWTVSSEELLRKDDKIFLRVRGSKISGPFASAEGEALFPVQMGEKGTFKILAGRGKVDIRVVDFMKQMQGYKSSEAIIKSSVDFGLAGRGIVSPGFRRVGGLKIVSEPKVYVTSGEGYVTPDMFQDFKLIRKAPSPFIDTLLGRGPKYTIKGTIGKREADIFTFGGLSRKEGEKVIFTSGKLLRARLYPSQGRFTGSFVPDVFGETLIKDTTTGAKSFISFKGGVAKSSKEFIDDLYKPTQKVITKQVSKTNIVSKIVGEQFGGQSFVSSSKTAAAGLKVTSSVIPQVTTIFGVGAKEFIKIKPITMPKSKDKVISKSLTKQKVIILEDTLSKQATSLFSDVSLTTKSLQDYATRTLQKPQTKQVQRQVTQTIPPTIFMPFPSAFPPITTPIGGIKLGIPLGWPSSKKVLSKKKQQGYLPQAKTKGGKWVTLSKKPMSRSSALSRASRASDNTTSAQFRIKKSKGKISPVKDNYFGRTSHKYRPYKIKKGKPIKLHDQFIEKRSKRIDTRGEKKGLKLAKYVKQQGWLAVTKKKKTKKKSPWLF